MTRLEKLACRGDLTYLQKTTTASSAFWPCRTTISRATPSSRLTEIVASTVAVGEEADSAVGHVNFLFGVRKRVK